MSIDQVEFRHVLGHFASSIAVVTTHHAGSCHGTTVSSFCSLSLKPPLVLVCIDHNSTSHDLIMASSAFGVNILAEQDEWLSRHFASRTPAKFSGVPHRLGQTGVPLFEEAIATLERRVVAQYPGGDHSIFIGEVVAANARQDRQPLLYFRSRYNRLGEQRRT